MELDPADAGALRADLLASGFTASGLRQLWGADADAAVMRGQLLPARMAVARRGTADARSTLARLFVLGDTVPEKVLATAIPQLGVEGAARLGLVEPLTGADQGSLRALVSMKPHTFLDAGGAIDWWIVSDLDEAVTRGPLRPDHVVGVGGASLTLLGLQPTARVSRVLDLGTGCGIQALLARRHADRVVATDISARALQFARLNAAINGVEGIDFRLGDLFQPVAGERFDRIISNPPFVVTPRSEEVPTMEYRDGGRAGDDLMMDLIAQLRSRLTHGGTAVLLGNWEYHAERDGLERIRLAAGRAGLDAWVIERDILSDSQYSETWIRDGGVLARTDRFDELYRSWLADFAARDVDRIGLGYLILRNPASGTPTLSRFERLHGALGADDTGLAGHLVACIAAHDWQVALTDDELLASRLTVAPDVTEQRHYWPGDEHPAVIDLRQGGGFGRTVEIDTALAGFVGACDGELSVRSISDAVAELLEADPAELRAELLSQIRDLIEIGILLPGTG